MKAYILNSEEKICPFDLPASQCLVLNETIKDYQVEVLRFLGIWPVFFPESSRLVDDSKEHIIFRGNCFFTPELLSEFVAESRKIGQRTTCYLRRGITTERTGVSVQNVEIMEDRVGYSLSYSPEGGPKGAVRPVVIDPDQFSACIPVPRHMCEGGKYLLPMSDKFIIEVNTWMNLWVANIMAILAIGARLQNLPKVKLLWCAIRAMSFNKWKILCKLNQIGKNCDIHQTAYIEGSTIGDNVIIGAGSVIRESVIGSDTFIGNGVVVESSSIGSNSTILNGHILYSVLLPGCFSVAEMVTASMIGCDSFMGSNSILTDFRFDGENVSILRNGTKADSGNMFLGCCLGQGVYIGSGIAIAPGRAIENNLRIVRRDSIKKSNLETKEEMAGFEVIKKNS